MQTDEIRDLIKSKITDSDVTVTGDGRHFEAVVISTHFEGMSLLARQRYVYSALGDNIRNGNIHALSIKAKTPNELIDD
ncbi:MAG: BolA family protein [Candidatus Berkiellales bacterium]